MQFYFFKYIMLLFFGTILIGCTHLLNNENEKEIKLSISKNNEIKTEIVWHCQIGNGINNYYSKLHLAYKKDFIFAADRCGLVKALDFNTGKEFWSIDLSNKKNNKTNNCSALLSGGISIDNKYLYIGSELAQVYAINLKNGNIIWKTVVSGEVLSSPKEHNNLIFIYTGNCTLHAIDKLNGNIVWTINLNSRSLSLRAKSSPILVYGTIIIGDDCGYIKVCSIDNGKIIWQQNICNNFHKNKFTNNLNGIYISPVVLNNTIYVSVYNSHLMALDLFSGKIKWSRNINVISNLLIDHKFIYFISDQNQIFALNQDNGKIIWQQKKLFNHNFTSLLFYKNYIVTSDLQGYIFFFKKNGDFVVNQKIDSHGILSEPIVVKNKLILQTKNGRIYVIKIT